MPRPVRKLGSALSIIVAALFVLAVVGVTSHFTNKTAHNKLRVMETSPAPPAPVLPIPTLPLR